VQNTSGTALQINNEDVFQAAYLTGSAWFCSGTIFARYPGPLGNSLTVSICDSTSTFASLECCYSTGTTITLASYFNGVQEHHHKQILPGPYMMKCMLW
jgi:hypothetical protein